MMNEPEISVIMPAYNAQEFIAESIDSVISQTYPSWELIIVDDGSTDGTATIAQQYSLNDSRVKYIYQQNGRQGKARNTGIKNSRGKYIAFLDADDLWEINKLQVQIAILAERPDIDLIFTQGYILAPEGSLTNSDVKIREWNWTKDGDEFIDCNQIPILSVIVKKEAIEKVGFFTESMDIQNAEDYHLWLKLLQKGCHFLSVPNRLFQYRIHGSQITYQNWGMHQAVLNGYFDLAKTGILSYENKALQFRIKWMILHNINPAKLYKKLKPVFPGKQSVLFFYVLLSRLFYGQKLLKRVASRVL